MSCEDVYDEYWISWTNSFFERRPDNNWEKSDEGTQVVVLCGGYVDIGENNSLVVEYRQSIEGYFKKVSTMMRKLHRQ